MRYRDEGHTTHRSLSAATKHTARLGTLTYVRGYVYRGRYGLKAGVIVRGENGTARFTGFSWGYGGTGPNGLNNLLRQLGVTEATARTTAFDTPWDTNSAGEKWRIDLRPTLFAA